MSGGSRLTEKNSEAYPPPPESATVQHVLIPRVIYLLMNILQVVQTNTKKFKKSLEKAKKKQTLQTSKH